MPVEYINIIQVLVVGKAKPVSPMSALSACRRICRRIYLRPEASDPAHIILYTEGDPAGLAQYSAFAYTDGCDDRRLRIPYQPELPKLPETARSPVPQPLRPLRFFFYALGTKHHHLFPESRRDRFVSLTDLYPHQQRLLQRHHRTADGEHGRRPIQCIIHYAASDMHGVVERLFPYIKGNIPCLISIQHTRIEHLARQWRRGDRSQGRRPILHLE